MNMPQNVTTQQRHTLQIQEISKIFREDMSMLKRLLVAMVSDVLVSCLKRLQPNALMERETGVQHMLSMMSSFFLRRSALLRCHSAACILACVNSVCSQNDVSSSWPFHPFLSHRERCMCEWREGTPLDRSPVHCRALSEHLCIHYLAQGYLSIALKMSWHLPLLECHACFVHTGTWSINPPLLSLVSNRLSDAFLFFF